MFSIIIATYNSEKTLKNALESIECQSIISSIEVIIVDGASKDQTVKIAGSFSNIDLKIVSEPDKGVFDAFNKGISRASNEWLLFLGSDDTIYNSAILEELSLKLKTLATETFIISTKIETVGSQGNIYTGESLNAVETPYSIFAKSPAPGLVFRKKLFEMRKFNTSFRASGDLEFLLDTYQRGVRPFFIQLPNPIVRFNSGGLSTSNNSIPLRIQEFLLAAKLTKAIPIEKVFVTYISLWTKYWIFKIFGNYALNNVAKCIQKIPGMKNIWKM